MKQLALVFAFIGLTAIGAQAQRFACVDIISILESMEEYKAAQDQLEEAAAQWRQQIDQKRDEIRGLYNKYQSEQVLLSEDAKLQREQEITKKEKEKWEYERQKFGPEGALFKKRQELVRPIQDKIYAAIEAYAERKGYDFIFDKGGNAGMLFINPKYDKTSDIKASLSK